MKKTIVFIFIFLFSLVLFAPKTFLWGHLEDRLLSKNIEIKKQSLDTRILALHVNDVAFSWKRLELLKSKQWQMSLFGVYNALSLQNNKTSFMRENLPIINLSHALWDPLHVKVFVPLDEGEIKGKFSLYERKGEMIFSPKDEKKIPAFVKRLYKKSAGGYVYAFSL